MVYKFIQPKWVDVGKYWQYKCRDAVYGRVYFKDEKKEHHWEAHPTYGFANETISGKSNSEEKAKLIVESIINGTRSSLYLQQNKDES